MESQEETTTGNGEEEFQTQNGDSEEQQEEGWGTDDEMVVDGGMEDWNGFITGGATLGEEREGEVVAEWRPGEPVTPQHVLSLNTYTKGESAVT